MQIIIILLLCTALSIQCADLNVVAKRDRSGQPIHHDEKPESNTPLGLNEFLRRKTSMQNYTCLPEQVLAQAGNGSGVHSDSRLHCGRYLVTTIHDDAVDENQRTIIWDIYTNQPVHSCFQSALHKHSSHSPLILLESFPHSSSTYQTWAYNTDNNTMQKVGSQMIKNEKAFCHDGSRFITIGAPTRQLEGSKSNTHKIIIRASETLEKVATLKCAKEHFRSQGSMDCTTRQYLLSDNGTQCLAHANNKNNKYGSKIDANDFFFVFEQFNIETKQKEMDVSIPQGICYAWDTQTGQDLYVVTQEEPGNIALKHYQHGALVGEQPLDAVSQAESSVAYLTPIYGKKVLICFAQKEAENCKVALYDADTHTVQPIALEPTIPIYDFGEKGPNNFIMDRAQHYVGFQTGKKEAQFLDIQDNAIIKRTFKYFVESITNIVGTTYARVICQELTKRHVRYLNVKKQTVRKRKPDIQPASDRTWYSWDGTTACGFGNHKHTCKDYNNASIEFATPPHIKPEAAAYYDAEHNYIELVCRVIKKHYYYIDMKTGQDINPDEIPCAEDTYIHRALRGYYKIIPHVNPKHMSEHEIDLMYRAMQHKKATKKALNVAGNQQDAATFDGLPVFLKACRNIIRNHAPKKEHL